MAFLKGLGFSLHLTQCAGGGDKDALSYVRPKTGLAVSANEGRAYKDRLLNLPPFLKPQAGVVNEAGVLGVLRMTGYFLEHWVFTHHSRGVPPARLLFEERFAKTVESQHLEETEEYHAAG